MCSELLLTLKMTKPTHSQFMHVISSKNENSLKYIYIYKYI